MKNHSPPSLDNDSWVSWFAQDNLQTTGWVGLDKCRYSEIDQGFRSEFASCERKLRNVERNVIILSILLIAKAAYFIQSNTFWHLQHAFACLICYQCKHAVTIVTTTGWHRLTASASNAFQFSSRHKKTRFCHIWTGRRDLSGSISLPAIGWHAQGTNCPIFYSFKEMNNKTFPSYLFRKRKKNYNCDYWTRMWDFFLSIHVCQNEEQSESLTQPPVRTDIQDFKVAQTARKRPFPKTSKGEDGNRSLVYRCVFFHKQWGVTQQCGGSRTDECLRGGGLHMKCQALCCGSRWTVSGEWGGGEVRGKMSGYQTERQREEEAEDEKV